MANDSNRSPWWYRRRGTVIGTIYGAGFLIGNVPFDGRVHDPAFVVLGALLPSTHGAAIVLWAAVASAVVAWLWRASGTAFLRSDVVFARDIRSDRLIVAGPYRYVRNPLYLGNLFLALAVGLIIPPAGLAIVVIGNAVIGAMLAAEESRQMSERYGARYAAFRAAVPAFVPRLSAATIDGSSDAVPAWRHGLVGEGFCLAFGIALVPIAVLGENGIPAFWEIWIPSMLVYGFLGALAGRRGAKAAL